MKKKKLTVIEKTGVTFKEGCEMYLDYCRERNLREHTIKHYQNSFNRLFKFFDMDMQLNDFTLESYNSYLKHLQETLNNDITISGYLRDLMTLIYYLQNQSYVEEFKMKSIKADRHAIETYNDSELDKLLKKPNTKCCTFLEYESWVICNLLFSTGLRQSSFINIRVRDVDLNNRLINIMHTKNRKPLLIPLNSTMANILKEFIKIRKPDDEDDYLFCNSFGEQLAKNTSYMMLREYNIRRGVTKVGIHRWRHTMAKNWVLNNGNVVTLCRLLGHSSLDITQNYLNLLVSDLSKAVDEVDILSKYGEKKSIKMR